jgi:hypothetical protein
MQDIPYDFAQGLLRTLKEARNIEISGEEFSFSGKHREADKNNS